MTIDFSKYFDNIDHESLFQMLSEQIKDKSLLALTKYYVQEFGPVGLGLGSQVSQILAVFFPNKIDHLNPKKARITPIKQGVEFLHCRYKFSWTGKIIKSGGRESVKRERRKLKKFKKKLDIGELDLDSKTLLKNTDKLYNKLFIEG